MDIPSRRSTCEDGRSNPKTKCLEYNQMDNCVTGVANMGREGDKSTSRTNEGDTDRRYSSTDEMEFDEESDEE